MRRSWILVSALLLLVSVSSARDVPELNVVPDTFEENLSAYNTHDLEFTFSNQDVDEDIFNVNLENTSYLSWPENRFDVGASESRTVNASFYTENITSFSDTIQSTYEYGGSDNSFDGPNISLDISTFYEETNVSISTFETEFEEEFDSPGQSVFRIENTGSETAFNVSLKGEDVEFGRGSGFDIPAGEDALVEYNVSIPKPEEDPTEATNQSYIRDIEVTGENFNDTGFEASVFVPFTQFDSEEAERSLIDQFIEFCSDPENSDSVTCSDEQIVRYENETETVYRTPEANITLTNEEIMALKELSEATTENYEDILHRVRLQQNTFRSELNATRSNFSEGLESVEDEDDALNPLHTGNHGFLVRQEMKGQTAYYEIDVREFKSTMNVVAGNIRSFLLS